MLSTSNARPKTVTVILAMLIVLALVSAITIATSRIGFGARGNNRVGTAQGGTFPGNNNNGTAQGGNNGNFQGNNNGTTPGQGGNFQGNNGNFQGRPNQNGFNLFTITRTLGLSPQVMVYVNIATPVIGILLLLLSAFGIWKQKSWGLNLATLMGLIFLIGALPTFFSLGGRNFNWLRTVPNIVSAIATLPILALSFLPSVRDYFPKTASKPRKR